MEIGIKNTLEITVTGNLTAAAVGSGTLNVYATPAMIVLIEETAWKSVAPYLEEGQFDGRRLVFAVNVYDKAGLIGKGTHERFIIMSEKFQAKADSKKS